MPVKEDLRWIKVGTTLYIPELRCDGPIVAPLQVPAKTALCIMNRGYRVIEVNPSNKKEEIELNLTNIFDPYRFGKKAEPTAPIPEAHKKIVAPEPKKQEVKEVEQPVVTLETVTISEEEVPLAAEAPVEVETVETPVEEVAATEESTQTQNYSNKKKNRK